MKATHLEQIAMDYEKSKEEQILMEKKIEEMSSVSKIDANDNFCIIIQSCSNSNVDQFYFPCVQSLPALEEKAKKLEEVVNSFKIYAEMEGKIEQLKNELKWAIVIKIEAVSCAHNVNIVLFTPDL